jgi:hypothetical protein
MGITKLSAYLSSSPVKDHASIKDKTLPADSTLVVDAANFMHKACYDSSLLEICAHLNGNYANFAKRVEEIVLNYVDVMGLNLVFVFESSHTEVDVAIGSASAADDTASAAFDSSTAEGGVYLCQKELKKFTNANRREERKSAWDYFDDFCKNYSQYPIKELPIPPLVSVTFKQAIMRLSEMRPNKVTAVHPTEDDQDADFCIARICRAGNERVVLSKDGRPDNRPTHYVFSNDTDFLVMAGTCPLIFINSDVLTGNKYTGLRAKRVWSRQAVADYLFPSDAVSTF